MGFKGLAFVSDLLNACESGKGAFMIFLLWIMAKGLLVHSDPKTRNQLKSSCLMEKNIHSVYTGISLNVNMFRYLSLDQTTFRV